MSDYENNKKVNEIDTEVDRLELAILVPAIDAVTNLNMRDVIGNKSDTVAGTSIVSLIKNVLYNMHNAQKIYPFNQDPVAIVTGGAIWTDDANTTTIVGHTATFDAAVVGDAGGGVITIAAAGHGFGLGHTIEITGCPRYNGVYTILQVAGGTFNITAAYQQATLDNAAAVDLGTGDVRIPATAHGFEIGETVTIAGTTNYNGAFVITDKTDDTFDITSAYVAETFAGTETAIFTFEVTHEAVDIINAPFSINNVNVFELSADAYYEVILYKGAAGAETEIGRIAVARIADKVAGDILTQESNIPITTEILPAKTRISARLNCSVAAAYSGALKIGYNTY